LFCFGFRILHWQPSQGAVVNSHILNEISQCVENFNGVKDGRTKATLTFYRPNLRDQSLSAEFPRDFLGISLMEQPNKYYFIIRGHKLAVEADSSILTIMEKLQSYKSKVTLNFEVYSSFSAFLFLVPLVLFIYMTHLGQQQLIYPIQHQLLLTQMSHINRTRWSIVFFINCLCAYGAGYTI